MGAAKGGYSKTNTTPGVPTAAKTGHKPKAAQPGRLANDDGKTMRPTKFGTAAGPLKPRP